MKLNNVAEGQVIAGGKSIFTEVIIQATPTKVWQVLTDFAGYPQWNPFINSFTGTPDVGEKVQLFIRPAGQKGMAISPTILQYQPNRELRWIGTMGVPYIFDGEHTFRILDNGNGSCTLQQYETFRGILVPFLQKMLDVNTKKGFEAMNEAIKQRSER